MPRSPLSRGLADVASLGNLAEVFGTLTSFEQTTSWSTEEMAIGIAPTCPSGAEQESEARGIGGRRNGSATTEGERAGPARPRRRRRKAVDMVVIHVDVVVAVVGYRLLVAMLCSNASSATARTCCEVPLNASAARRLINGRANCRKRVDKLRRGPSLADNAPWDGETSHQFELVDALFGSQHMGIQNAEADIAVATRTSLPRVLTPPNRPGRWYRMPHGAQPA